ncbi:MAG: pyridoxal 5'-phosphate synthase glutaminase subunit PdxT [Acholeplasmataceae bacterium]
MTIGILALQGAFIEHQHMLNQLNIDSFLIRNAKDLSQPMDGIILPGGESTTMRRLLDSLNLYQPLNNMIKKGLPTLGTCAGMILLADHIENDQTDHFRLLPVTVKRNAYGRQLGSFYTEDSFNGKHIPMVFIRAPYVIKASPDVNILSEVDGHIVAVSYQNILATAFHPELSDDLTVLKHFIDMIHNQA